MSGLSVAARRIGIGVAAATVGSFGIGAAAWAAPMETQSVVITIDAVTGSQTFTATGPVNGSGFDTPLSSRPTGSVTHNVDQFTLTSGPQSGSTFTVKSVGRQSVTFDPGTCSAVISGSGNYVTTSGSGALTQVKGAGHFTVTGTIGFMSSTGCNPNANPTSGGEVVTASGQGKV